MEFDPTKVIASTPQAGQSEASSAAAPEPGKELKPEAGLTIEQVQQAMKATVSEALSAWERSQQSQRDKLEARIHKSVQAQISSLKASGIDVTDDMKASLANAAREVIRAEAEGEPSPAAAAQAAPAETATKTAPAAQQPQADPNQMFYQLAGEILQEYGVSFDENDPEAAKLKAFSGTPRQFLKLVEEQAEAKRARVSQSPQTTTPMMAGGTTPTNPISDLKDPSALWEIAKKKIYGGV